MGEKLGVSEEVLMGMQERIEGRDEVPELPSRKTSSDRKGDLERYKRMRIEELEEERQRKKDFYDRICRDVDELENELQALGPGDKSRGNMERRLRAKNNTKDVLKKDIEALDERIDTHERGIGRLRKKRN